MIRLRPEEPGDLSHAQMRRLLIPSNWLASDAPIRLNRTIAFAELEKANLFHDVRALMTLAVAMDGLPLTNAGNLKVAIVQLMLDRLRIDPGEVDFIREHFKRTTEGDVRQLEEAHYIAEFSQVLIRERGRLRLADRDLLDEANAGMLYARLFEGCFRSMDLTADAPRDWPGLQQQIIFTLSRLGHSAREWTTPEAIMEKAILPGALRSAPTHGSYLLPAMIFETQVLLRLVAFGLLDCSEVRWDLSDSDPRYRVTPLYSRFLSFDL